jgi:predicted TIM-barrel fold metal-dependent hydrolase/AcrR family transcriptional regulator
VRRGPGRPPGPSQAADVRARIVAEASRLYAAGGYAGLSFGTLAARVGITKPTVFHYFSTKDALAIAVFDALGERLEGRAHEWFAAPPTSYAARLEKSLKGLIEFYGKAPVNAQIVCHGLLEVERLIKRAGAEDLTVFAEFVREFVAFLEAGIAAGEFHDDRPLGTDRVDRRRRPVRVHAARRRAKAVRRARSHARRPDARGDRVRAPRRRATEKGINVTNTIDADGHVIEPADLWERELPASLKSRGFSVRWNADTRQEEVHVEDRCLLPFGIVGVGLAGRPFTDIGVGVRYSELHPGGFDPKKRLQDLDAERIDTAVLYPSIGLLLEAIEDPVLAEACCRVYNDWLADYCKTDPKRLVGVAGMPMQDVNAAVREMQRAKTIGMRGVFIRPNPVKNRALHDPYFDPFWAACQEADMPVGIHPSGCGDLPGALQGLRLDAPIMGHPTIFFVDEMIGFSHLVCGGVLERHPRLKVVVLEAGGGWLGHWFDRFDHFAPGLRLDGARAEAEAVAVLQAPVLDLVRPRRVHAPGADADHRGGPHRVGVGLPAPRRHVPGRRR